MKNKNIKIIALLLVATVGLVALYRSKKSETITESVSVKENDLETLLSEATSENPFFFYKKTDNPEVSMSYVFNGTKYTKQLMGPSVRSIPVNITKEEFVEAYNAYLL